MINKDSIESLYELLNNQTTINSKELKKIGFGFFDIISLVHNNYISKIKLGIFTWPSLEVMLEYKKQKSNKNQEQKSRNYIESNEIDSKNINSCLTLLFHSLKARKYELAIKICDIMYHRLEKNYINDSNYYLFLLNFITDIPNKYREYLKYTMVM